MAESEEWLLPVRPCPCPPDIAPALAKPPSIVLAAPDAPGPSTRDGYDSFVVRFAAPRVVPGIFTGHGEDGR
jgi:hypothetical protein